MWMQYYRKRHLDSNYLWMQTINAYTIAAISIIILTVY